MANEEDVVAFDSGSDIPNLAPADPEISFDGDIPVVGEGFQEEADQPIDPTPFDPTSVPAIEATDTKSRKIAQAAIIRADLGGTNEVSEYQTLSREGIAQTGESIRDAEVKRQFSEEQAELVAQGLVGTPGVDPTIQMEALSAEMSDRQAKLQQYDAASRALMDALAAANTPIEIFENEVQRAAVADVMQELNDGLTLGDVARDLFLEVVVPFKFILDNVQATDTINPFEARRVMEDMIVKFKRSSGEEQTRLFESMRLHLMTELPETRAIDLLNIMTDPSIDETLALEEFRGFAIAEMIPIVGGLIWGANRLRKGTNSVKSAARLGNKDKSSQLNTAVLADESGEAGVALDVDRLTAHNNAMPSADEIFDEAAVDGMAPDAQRRLHEFITKLDETRDNVLSGKTFVREGVLDEEDQARAIVSADNKYREDIAKQFSDDPGQAELVEMQVLDVNSDRATLEWTVRAKDGEVTQIDQLTAEFTIDEAGEFTMNNVGAIGDTFSSPKIKARGSNVKNTVDAAIRLEGATAKIADDFRKAMNHVAEPLKTLGKIAKKKMEEVDAILLIGDRHATEYSVNELKGGIGGIKLDDAQIETYFRARAAFNRLFEINNDEAVRLARANNTKAVKIRNKGDDTDLSSGRVIDDVNVAKATIRNQTGIVKVYDVNTGRAVSVRELDLDAVYASGNRLVRLTDSESFGRAGKFRHVIMPNKNVGGTPRRLLDPVTGYVTRSNPNARFFVQQLDDVVIDGVTEQSKRAVRSFQTRKEALAFARRMNSNPDNPSTTNFVALKDRELEDANLGDSGMTPVAGLFKGKRARKPVPHGNPGEFDQEQLRNMQLTAFESLQLYAENLSHMIPRNEWRMGAREKWENTARSLFPGTRNIEFDTFAAGGTGEKAQFLNRWRDEINRWSGIKTKSENWWEGFTDRISEASVGSRLVGPKFRENINSVGQVDPVNALKGITFHGLLGVFNTRQLLIQAQGAAISASMNLFRPDRLAVILGRQLGLRMLQFMNPVHLDGKLGKAIALQMGMSPKKMKKVKELWDRSGLHQSMFTNADIQAVEAGMPMSRGVFKRVFDAGLLFYREGEGFNRRFAFLTAVDKLDLDELVTNDLLFKEAVTRANDLTLNLSRANGAAFQRGPLAVPTQFWQVIAKTFEQIFNPFTKKGGGSDFTVAERLRILVGQFALYGAAGLPLGQLGSRYMMEMGGIDRGDLEDPAKAALVKQWNGGLMDSIPMYLFNADVSVADGTSLVQGLNDFVVSMYADGTTPWEIAFGASTLAPTRLWEKFNEISYMFAGGMDIIDDPKWGRDSSIEIMKILVGGVGDATLSATSTWSNKQKARFLRNLDRTFDSKGNVVANREFNWFEESSTVLGFQVGEVQRNFDIGSMQADRQDEVNEMSTALVKLSNRGWLLQAEASAEGRQVSPEMKEMMARAKQLLLLGIEDEQVRADVQAAYQRKINSQSETQLGKKVDAARQAWGSSVVDSWSSPQLNQRAVPLVETLGER